MDDSLLGDRNSESREGSIQVVYAGADERQFSGGTDDSIYDNNMGGSMEEQLVVSVPPPDGHPIHLMKCYTMRGIVNGVIPWYCSD